LLPLSYAQAGSLQQVGLSIQRNEIELNFPNGLTFHLEADAPGEAQKVYLNYGTNGRSCLQGISRQAIDIEVGTEIAASWEWDFIQRGSLPPGVEIWWEWESCSPTVKAWSPSVYPIRWKTRVSIGSRE
jgi:hypothetical protein